MVTWSSLPFAVNVMLNLSNVSDFGDVTTCQIHHFADASQIADDAVSYLRITNARGLIHCSKEQALSYLCGKSGGYNTGGRLAVETR